MHNGISHGWMPVNLDNKLEIRAPEGAFYILIYDLEAKKYDLRCPQFPSNSVKVLI